MAPPRFSSGIGRAVAELPQSIREVPKPPLSLAGL
jgi:hypothetical protein